MGHGTESVNGLKFQGSGLVTPAWFVLAMNRNNDGACFHEQVVYGVTLRVDGFH